MSEDEKKKSSHEQSVWETLSKIDVSGFTEQKNGLTYLSWAHAWGALKTYYPDASFEKMTFENVIAMKAGEYCVSMTLPYLVDATGYAYVQVRVCAGDQVAAEFFPVLDHKNKAVQWPDSFQVNTALQRCLAKAIAYLGLGHHVYAGEDLPISFEHKEPETSIVENDGSVQVVSTAEKVKEVFIRMIPLHHDIDSLMKFYTQNEAALLFLQDKDAEAYSAVVGAFSKAKKTLTAKKDA